MLPCYKYTVQFEVMCRRRLMPFQVYSVAGSQLCLTGTAEVPLGAVYMDQILTEQQLPVKMAAFGHCFRTEAGAGGEQILAGSTSPLCLACVLRAFAWLSPSPSSACMHCAGSCVLVRASRLYIQLSNSCSRSGKDAVATHRHEHKWITTVNVCVSHKLSARAAKSTARLPEQASTPHSTVECSMVSFEPNALWLRSDPVHTS